MAEVSGRELRVPSGDRVLDVLDAGVEGGPLVIVHSGTPGSRELFDGWVDDAVSRGIRLVGYSRPGYSLSTRAPGRNVAQCVEDVVAIADSLGAERFATWGVSGGGPHALACAARLPDRVVAVATLASVAPYGADGLDFLAGMGEDNVVEFEAALAGEAAIAPMHEEWVKEMSGASPEEIAGQLESLLSPVDRAVFSDAFGEYLAVCLKYGVATGPAGWIDDDLAFTRPWGFDVADIRVPVQVWQGPHDLMVPPAHGAWLAAHIPGAEHRFEPDDGHLVLVAKRVPAVHEWLLSHL